MNDITMNRLHTFTIVTDGKAKAVKASAMGPIGSGESVVEAAPVEPLLTVAEQKAKAEANTNG